MALLLIVVIVLVPMLVAGAVAFRAGRSGRGRSRRSVARS